MFKRKDIVEDEHEEVYSSRIERPELEISEMNSVVLEGHIISPINWKDTEKATVCNFKLLNRKKHKGTTYNSPFNIVCWNSIADLVRDNLVIGDKVKIVGELKHERWDAPYGMVDVVKVQAFRISYNEKD